MENHSGADAVSTDHATPTLSRRTVVKGVAWAVPAIAVASAAPAFASSGCLGIADAVDWETYIPKNGNPVNDQTAEQTADANGDSYFNMWVDSTAAKGNGNKARIYARSNVLTGLVPGCTYTIQVRVATQGGYDGRCKDGTVNTDMFLYAEPSTNTWTNTSNAALIKSWSTQDVHGAGSGFTVVPFPTQQPHGHDSDSCPGDHGFGKAGSVTGSAYATPFALSFYATSTDMRLKLMFVPWDNNNTGNNDDYHVWITSTGDCDCKAE